MLILSAMLFLTGCISYNLSSESQISLSKMSFEQARDSLLEVSKLNENGHGICSYPGATLNKVTSSSGDALYNTPTAEIKSVHEGFFEIYVVSQRNCSLVDTTKTSWTGSAMEEKHNCESYYSDEIKIYYKDIKFVDKLGVDALKECKHTNESNTFKIVTNYIAEHNDKIFLYYDLNDSDGDKLVTALMYLAPNASFRKMM